jgi:hypothetical protein
VLTTQNSEFERDLLWLSPLNPVLMPLIDISLHEAVTSYWALDNAMIHILHTVKEPALRQIRLAWWRENILKLGATAPPAEPVLAGLSQHVLPIIAPEILVEMIDAWEVLFIEEQQNLDIISEFASDYGPRLFAGLYHILGVQVPADIEHAIRYCLVRHALFLPDAESSHKNFRQHLFWIALRDDHKLAPAKPRLTRALDRLMLRLAYQNGKRSPVREQLSLFRASLFG